MASPKTSNASPDDPTPNKVKIDRRAGAGLAVHNAFEECVEHKEQLWSIKAFDKNAVRDLSNVCDGFISKILPSSYLCNPFLHVELFGRNIHIVCESGSFGAPRRDEFIFDASQGTKLHFGEAQMEHDDSDEKESIFKPSSDMYLVVQIMDDEGTQGRDRVIGESIVTLSNFDFDSNGNYCELTMYEPRNLKYCGTIFMNGQCKETTDDKNKITKWLEFEFIGIKGFRDDNAYLVKDDTYTETRNDLIILFAWFSYMLLACALYVWLEGFSFGDCMYIRIVTAFTVGYGDIYPITRAGKILNMFFIIIDTVTLGYIAGKVMKYILAFREKKAKENENAELEEDLNPKENAKNNDKNVSKNDNNNNNNNNKMETNEPLTKQLSAPGEMGAKQKSGSMTGGDRGAGSRMTRTGSVARAVNYQGVSAATHANRMHEAANDTKRKLYYIGLVVIGYIVAGTLWFTFVEGFTFAESFEWNFVTLSTVGYGNVTPQTSAGKVFTCIYIITGVTTLAYFATTAFEYIEDKKAEAFREQMISGALINEAQLLEFDSDGDGKIDKYEFLAKMVVMTGECEQEKIDEIMKKFNELDEDGGGTISVEELRKFEQQAAA